MLEKVERILKKIPDGQDSIMAALHGLQDEFGYIPKNALELVSKKRSVPMSILYRMITSYKAFRTEKPSGHTVTVCNGTCCHLKGSETIAEKIKTISEENSSEITIEHTRCMGCCDMSPALMIDGKVYKEQDAQAKISDILSK
jgi:NADH:ubiquinone oxidoreductase subunit E